MPEQPYSKALAGLKNLGIQPDPAQQWREQHPVIAGVGDFLTGGATDPNYRPGPVDMLMHALPGMAAVPFARFPKNIMNPAVEELVNILRTPLDPVNPAKLFSAEGKVSGSRIRTPQPITAPAGFTFDKGLGQIGRNPEIVRQQATQDNFFNSLSQKSRLGRDAREYMEGRYVNTKPAPLAYNQIEQVPVATSLEELRSLSPTVSNESSRLPPPRLARNLNPARPRPNSNNTSRSTVKDLQSDMIEQVQRAAGTNKSMAEINAMFPNLSRDTLQKVLKMPWKWTP